MRTGQGIATQSAKMKRAGKAVAVGVECARRLERSQVKKPIRTLSTCKRVTNEVGSRKEFAGAVKVAGEVIVQVKWVTTTQNEHSVELPTFAEARMSGREAGDVVTEAPYKTMATIEVGITTLMVRTETVIGLRGIGHVILTVRCVVDRMRPGVVDH